VDDPTKPCGQCPHPCPEHRTHAALDMLNVVGDYDDLINIGHRNGLYLKAKALIAHDRMLAGGAA